MTCVAKKINNSRKHRADLDARELRLAKLAEYRAKRISLVQYAEDMGVDYRTAQRDVVEFKRRQVAMVQDAVGFDAMIQRDEINQLKAELQILRARLAASEGMPADKRFAIALAIINQDVKIMEREASLLGLDAPKKTVTAHLTTDQTGRFHEVIEACAGLDEDQFKDGLRYLREIPRKALPAPAGPPPLLPEGE